MDWLIFSTKAVVLVLSLIFLFALQARLEVRALSALRALLAWALVRDFLFTLAPIAPINFIGDLGIYSLLLLWIRYYSGRKSGDSLFTLAVFLSAGTAIALYLRPIPNAYLVYGLLNALLLAYLIAALSAITVHNTRDAEIIVDTRVVLIVATLLLGIVGSLTSYSYSALGHLTAILFYFAIWLVLLSEFQLYYVVSELTAARLERQSENLFDFMEALGNGIAQRVDIQRILDMVVTSASKTVESDGAVIMMVDEQRKALRVRAMEGFYPPPYAVPEAVKHRSASLREYLYAQVIPIGETLLGESVQEGEPIFIEDSASDERLRENLGRDFLFIQSLIAVPLIVSNRVLGVISLVRRNPNRPFGEVDFQHVMTFAKHASITIDNFHTYLEVIENREVQREISIAADIQSKLVPHRFPMTRGADIAVYSKPARGVSGDYYDVISLDDDKIGIAMCDVAGKGVPAALVMVMIHSILRLIASADREVGSTLTWLNRGLSGRIDLDHYATMSYLTLKQKSRELSYSNAAHHPLMIVRRESNTIEEIDSEGLPVGIEAESVYPQKSVTLKAGDILILYTDGIIEAMNPDGEQFTVERLSRAIRENSHASADAITKAIRGKLDEFVGSARQHDDQTLLVIRVE